MTPKFLILLEPLKSTKYTNFHYKKKRPWRQNFELSSKPKKYYTIYRQSSVRSNSCGNRLKLVLEYFKTRFANRLKLVLGIACYSFWESCEIRFGKVPGRTIIHSKSKF